MEGNLPSDSMFPGTGSYGGVVLDWERSTSFHFPQQRQPQSSLMDHQLLFHPTQEFVGHPLMDDTSLLSTENWKDSDHTIPVAEYAVGEGSKLSGYEEALSFGLPLMEDTSPLSTENWKGSDHTSPIAEYAIGERGKVCGCEEHPNFTNVAENGNKSDHYHRAKWDDAMVTLLFNAASYIREDSVAVYGLGERRKNANQHTIGKWRAISQVMKERGHTISPQQCEDKFNELNRKYKRLNDILGSENAGKVNENRSLLDTMDQIPEKAKEDVRKILSSKHLHLEEMRSYHNENRLHLPSDPELRRSLWLILGSKENHANNVVSKRPRDDEDDQDDVMLMNGTPEASTKRMKLGQGREDFTFGNYFSSFGSNGTSNLAPQSAHVEMNQVLPEGKLKNQLNAELMNQRWLRLQEMKLKLKAERVKFEKEGYKWKHCCHEKDRELDKMRIANLTMRLENEHMALELKLNEMATKNRN